MPSKQFLIAFNYTSSLIKRKIVFTVNNFAFARFHKFLQNFLCTSRNRPAALFISRLPKAVAQQEILRGNGSKIAKAIKRIWHISLS